VFFFYENEKRLKESRRYLSHTISKNDVLFDELNNKYKEINVSDTSENIKEKVVSSQFELSMETFDLLIALMHQTFSLTNEDHRSIKNYNSLGKKIKDRNSNIKSFDKNQFEYVHSDIT